MPSVNAARFMKCTVVFSTDLGSLATHLNTDKTKKSNIQKIIFERRIPFVGSFMNTDFGVKSLRFGRQPL